MNRLTYLLLMAFALIVSGCGGGGGGSTSGSGNVGLFVTDDLHTGWQAVWVTIHKVELERQGAGFVTIFEDSAGKVLNLRALHDGSQRFAFFGRDGVPEGNYTAIRFTLDKDVQISQNGSSTNLPRVFENSLIDPSNPERALLLLTYATPKSVAGGSSDLVADFDLATWTENGTQIQGAVVVEGAGVGLNNPDRHVSDDFEGTISGLAGASPNFTFTLNLRSGNTVAVSTSTSTAVYNNDGTPNPNLANGKRVEVRGAFDPIARRIAATSIKIKNDDDDDDEVEGAAINVLALEGQFDVTIDRAVGFVPTEPSVHVLTTSTTRYFSRGGTPLTKDQFFSVLALGNIRVEVEGDWTAGTNTLLAKKAKIEDEDQDRQAEAKGSPNTINVLFGTFRIQLSEWHGFSSTVGTQINIVTHAGTRFRNEDEDISKEEFFAQLATATLVKVEGTYENGTITASEARIRTGSGGGGGQAEAEGAAVNVNSTLREFGISLISWEGFTGSTGMIVNVKMTDFATYRGLNGENLTAGQFFALLPAGQLVEAEGSYNSSTNTLTASKAKLED